MTLKTIKSKIREPFFAFYKLTFYFINRKHEKGATFATVNSETL